MVERDEHGPEKAEQLSRKLLEYVQNAEFGSAAYLALSDYFEVADLQDSLRTEIRNAINTSEDLESTRYWESEVHITETRIALRKHEISQRKDQIEGYAKADLDIYILVDELFSVAHDEAGKLFPDNPDERSKLTGKIYRDIYNQAHSAFIEIRENKQPFE